MPYAQGIPTCQEAPSPKQTWAVGTLVHSLPSWWETGK